MIKIILIFMLFQVCLADYTVTEAEMGLIKTKLQKLHTIETSTPEITFAAYTQIRTWDSKFYSPNFLTGTLEIGDLTYSIKYPFQPKVEFREKPQRYFWQPDIKFGFMAFNQNILNYDLWADSRKVILIEPFRYRKMGVNLLIGNPYWGVTLSRVLIGNVDIHAGVVKHQKYYPVVGVSFRVISF